MRYLIIFIALIDLGCKSKDGCDVVYTDACNNALAKDLGIVGSFNSTATGKYIEIINASCKDLSTKNYTLGNNSNQDVYKLPIVTLKSGERKRFTQADLNFDISDKNDIFYLKYKGKTIDTWTIL